MSSAPTMSGTIPPTPSTMASGITQGTTGTTMGSSVPSTPMASRARMAADAKAQEILRNLVSVADLQSIVHYQTSGLLRDPRATTNTIQAKISRRGGTGIKNRDIPSRGVPIRHDGQLVSPLILASRHLNKYAGNTRAVNPADLAAFCESGFQEYDTDRDGRVAVSAARELLQQLGRALTGRDPDPATLRAWERRTSMTHGSHLTLLGLVDAVKYLFGDRVSSQPRGRDGGGGTLWLPPRASGVYRPASAFGPDAYQHGAPSQDADHAAALVHGDENGEQSSGVMPHEAQGGTEGAAPAFHQAMQGKGPLEDGDGDGDEDEDEDEDEDHGDVNDKGASDPEAVHTASASRGGAHGETPSPQQQQQQQQQQQRRQQAREPETEPQQQRQELGVPTHMGNASLESPPIPSPTHTMRTIGTVSTTVGGTLRQTTELPASFQEARHIGPFEKLNERSQSLRRFSYGTVAGAGIEVCVLCGCSYC